MTPRDVIEAYWKFESQRNLQAVLDCYHEDASLQVPSLGRLTGHAAIRSFYQASIARFPVLEVAIVGAIESGDEGAFEWRSKFLDHAGLAYPLQGVNMIKIRDGKFAQVHVYYDPAEILAPAASG